MERTLAYQKKALLTMGIIARERGLGYNRRKSVVLVMKCPKCNAETPENTRFCSNCGTQLTSVEKPPVSRTRTIQTPLKEFTRGSTISQRYEVIEELGRGGMGRVYKVLDKQIEEEIALKVLNPDIVPDEKTKQRKSER